MNNLTVSSNAIFYFKLKSSTPSKATRRFRQTARHDGRLSSVGHSFELRQPLAVGVRMRADLVERDGLEAEPPRRRILRQPETVRRHGDLGRRHEVVPHLEHLRLAMPADLEPFADADVSRNDVAL